MTLIRDYSIAGYDATLAAILQSQPKLTLNISGGAAGGVALGYFVRNGTIKSFMMESGRCYVLPSL